MLNEVFLVVVLWKAHQLYRGEGDEERQGGPLWSPALRGILPDSEHTVEGRRATIKVLSHPPNRSRPCGILGLRLKLMPITADLSAPHGFPAIPMKRLESMNKPPTAINCSKPHQIL